MKKILAIIAALSMFIGNSAFALDYGSEYNGYESVSNSTFKDVPEGHWAKDNIARAVDKGWFSGYPDGTFHPNDPINRAEAMTVFVNFLGLEVKTPQRSTYHDVKLKDWYCPYIEAGKKLFPPITTFDGQKPFQPTMPMTREDTVYALVTALRYTDDTINANQAVLNMFKDQNSISALIKPYVAVAVNKGLVAGHSDGTIGAQDPLTRAEFATLLYRASFVGFGDSELILEEVVNEVMSVSVSETYYLELDDTVVVNAWARMSDGTNADYSSHVNLATTSDCIEVMGRTIKGIAPGEATVTFLDDEYLADKQITVTVIAPTAVPQFEDLDYPETTAEEKAIISGYVSDENDTDLTLKIDGDEVILADNTFEKEVRLNEGLNTFRLVLTNEYGVTNEKTVKIRREEPATVVAYEWSTDSVELEVGETVTIDLIEVYSDGTERKVTSDYNYSSNDEEVATINNRGKITAVGGGTTKISFSSGAVGGTVSFPRPLTVTVNAPEEEEEEEDIEEEIPEEDEEAVITAYKWSVNSLSLDAGETANIKLLEVYSDGSEIDVTSDYNFKSSNTAVAAVNGGRVKAVSGGTTNISFSSGAIGGSISMPRPLKVTVTGNVSSGNTTDSQPSSNATLTGLEWSTDEVVVSAGSSVEIKLYGVYSDGSKRDLTEECDVYSDDEDVAVVNGNTLKGINAGTTELWFSSIPKANIGMPGTITVIVE